MTDTEDPNIATLRDYVRKGSVNGTTERQDEEALSAVSALASTLAERDRRIAAANEEKTAFALRALAELARTSQLFDGESYNALRESIATGEFK